MCPLHSVFLWALRRLFVHILYRRWFVYILQRFRLRDLGKDVMLDMLLRIHLLLQQHVLLPVLVPVSRYARVQASRFGMTRGREAEKETCSSSFGWRRSASSCACCCLSNVLYCTHTHTHTHFVGASSGLRMHCRAVLGMQCPAHSISNVNLAHAAWQLLARILPHSSCWRTPSHAVSCTHVNTRYCTHVTTGYCTHALCPCLRLHKGSQALPTTHTGS